MNLDYQEIRQIESWTSMKVGDVVFDSNIHNWSQNTSVFDKTLMNKSNLIFIVEDTNGNKFGWYLNSAIRRTTNYIYDPNAFVFSLQSNGRLNGMKKFPIKVPSQACWLYSEDETWLISVGDGGGGNNDDINIMKSDYMNEKPGCGCSQNSYEYGRERNVLCGRKNFTLKRLVVIQMK